MHRFFTSKENINDKELFITGDDVKHIRNVLRLNIGDFIEICDGEKNEFIVKIDDIQKDKIRGSIINKRNSKGEPPVDIVLYQGLPKSDKMDLIIQKAVELGVSRVIPVIMSRTIVKLKDKSKEQKKIERWQKISLEASKQSKRGIIPTIDEIVTFNEMISILENEQFILVPYESENKIGLKEVLKRYSSGRINIIIGPEGGFENEEIEILRKLNSNIISLGPRILRTETAGFTTISIVMYELGDLGVI